MLEVLIRETAARFGVGDKAQPLVQMLLAAMTDKNSGSLAGFLEKFKVAGLGPLVQSWLGGGDGAQPLVNTQIETVLGANGGLLETLSAQLGLPRDQITSAIGYLLPALVGRLTPGGNLLASLPPDIASHVQAGQGVLSQAAQVVQVVQTIQRTRAGGGPKWLVWIIAIVVVLAALYAWRTSQHGAPSAQPAANTNAYTPPTPHSQPPTPGATFGGGGMPSTPPASAAAPAASETTAPAASAAN